MKKYVFLFLLLMALVNVVHAGDYVYKSGFVIKDIRVSGSHAYINTTVQPAGTCSLYGSYVSFKLDSDAGKILYSSILAAYIAGKVVDFWYFKSDAPGSDQNSGCTGINHSKLTMIKIRNPG